MHANEPTGPCSCGCGTIAVERNRYFTGKFLGAREFAAEQAYFLGRHRLHNRLAHGWGIACGLGVTRHPDRKDCPDWVVIGPGIAYDCCGRELVLLSETRHRLVRPDVPVEEDTEPPAGKERPDPCPPEREKGDGPEQERPRPEPPSDEPARYLLCAVYCEEAVECVPVLYDNSGHCGADTQPNRIRESVRFDLRKAEDLPGCWRQRGGDEARCRDDCDEELPAAGGGCIEADCECGHCVPLALVTYRGDEFELDTDGRRMLAAPSEALTHITRTSWVHGGTMTMDELRERGRLEIEFDRRIRPADGLATGVNRETFIVQHAGEGETIEFVPYDLDQPARLVDDCRAVFTLDPGFLSSRRRGTLLGSVVYVTLFCDFVLDCRGLPVDGDHLGGLLPTGNGTQGGTFRSWFRVSDEEGEAS